MGEIKRQVLGLVPADRYRGIPRLGLPFEWRLVARCNTGTWNVAAAEVNTGRLPPGLEIEPEYFRIVGVPTRAGSFSFQMLFRGIECPGSHYLPYGDYNASYTITVTGS